MTAGKDFELKEEYGRAQVVRSSDDYGTEVQGLPERVEDGVGLGNLPKDIQRAVALELSRRWAEFAKGVVCDD